MNDNIELYDDHDRGYLTDAEDRRYIIDDLPTEEIELTEVIR